MPSVAITDANFDELTEKHPLLILDFWAEWCGPCHSFAPIYEAAADRHPDILFGKVDTTAEEKLAREFQIFSVPTLIAAQDGTIVYARPGTLTAEKLEALVRDLRSGKLSLPE